jgi:hypothetical protein
MYRTNFTFTPAATPGNIFRHICLLRWNFIRGPSVRKPLTGKGGQVSDSVRLQGDSAARQSVDTMRLEH